jgi:hypothetical protein
MCREALQAAGVSPIVRFHQAVDENHDEPANTCLWQHRARN